MSKQSEEYFKAHFNELITKYPEFKVFSAPRLFSALCIKYFYYSDGKPFDQDQVKETIVDGVDDGGIDAVFNDPTSDNNDLIIVQSKFYNVATLGADDVFGELTKINTTVRDIKHNRVNQYRKEVVDGFRYAQGNMEDNGIIKVVFFTSFSPENKRKRNQLEKNLKTDLSDVDQVEINYLTDIQSQIDMIDNGKPFVDHDKLEIDEKDNFLEYEDSIIVNISAHSLAELQSRRKNGLLGMNLRYYIRKREVDSGIENTIKNEPKNFWYKNNGILIVCDDYCIDGKVLKLDNFSIVNGGQTTYKIGKADIENDFYIQCKVIKSKGETKEEKDRFISGIAESTNSQKAIKKADLLANSPVQISLREQFSKQHVYYIIKKGDKPPKQFSYPYQILTIEDLGKLGLAVLLQMPGTSRSNSAQMYSKNNYGDIFNESLHVGYIVDALKIGFYYGEFKKSLKSNDRGLDESSTLPMIKNGERWQLACIAYLNKVINNVFSHDEVKKSDDIEKLKKLLRNMGDSNRIINNQLQNEEEILFNVFEIIGDDVLGYCYNNAVDKAKEEQKTLAPSDYLKLDNNYYQDVIKRLWTTYNRNKNLKKYIDSLCREKK